MLRIVVVEPENGTTVLQLQGKVIGPWVDELRRTCGQALERSGRLALDLSDVRYLDQEAVALLHELRRSRVAVSGCSGFVAEQLKKRG